MYGHTFQPLAIAAVLVHVHKNIVEKTNKKTIFIIQVSIMHIVYVVPLLHWGSIQYLYKC